MISDFRWIEWNINQVEKHGLTVAEVESIVLNAKRPHPRRVENDKWQVVGRGTGDRMVEVFYLVDDDRTTAFVIHAMQVFTGKRK